MGKARFALAVGVISLLAGVASAQEIHSPAHCLAGCPAGAPATNDLIVREIYVLSSNDETKLADWVTYRITEETIGPTEDRNFRKVPLLDRPGSRSRRTRLAPRLTSSGPGGCR